MNFKDRCFSVTVHTAHLDIPTGALGPPAVAVSASGEGEPLTTPSNRESVPTFARYLDEVGKLFDDGVLDYAVISLEESSKGVRHLQGFTVFNETAFSVGKGKTARKPTEWLSGHWTKARSLSGARDYCAAVGIHIKKPGLFGVVEFGTWVDPGWNQTLRSRLIYQLAAEIEHGTTMIDLCVKMPAAVLLVGNQNLSNLEEMRGLASSTKPRSLATEPYYYIGRTFLASEFLNSEYYSSFDSSEEE